MPDAAKAEEGRRERSSTQHRCVDRPLAASSERGGCDRDGDQQVSDPRGCAQRFVESELQRLVQRVRDYFPLVAKYISISASRITNATAVAIGP